VAVISVDFDGDVIENEYQGYKDAGAEVLLDYRAPEVN